MVSLSLGLVVSRGVFVFPFALPYDGSRLGRRLSPMLRPAGAQASAAATRGGGSAGETSRTSMTHQPKEERSEEGANWVWGQAVGVYVLRRGSAEEVSVPEEARGRGL